MTDTELVQEAHAEIDALHDTQDPSSDAVLTAFEATLNYHRSDDPDGLDSLKQLADALDDVVVDTDEQTINWDLLFTVAAEYRPADITTVPLQYPVSNAISRNIIRERTWNDDADAIPTDALRYIRTLDWEIDGDYTAEHKSIYAWGWGHSEEPVEHKYRISANSNDITALIGGLPHLMILDQETCTEFVVEHVIERNFYYDEHIEEPSHFSSPKTKAEQNFEALNEIYGSLKHIGQREVNDRTIDSPGGPRGWSVFDFRGDFTYTDTTLNRLHTAFPDQIIEKNGQLDEPFRF